MRILSKILFGIIALIILIVGYFIGTFILLFIFGLIALMSLFFVLTIVFNNIVNISTHKYVKHFTKLIFAGTLSYLAFLLLWVLSKNYLLSLDLYLLFTIIWVVISLVFGICWAILKQREAAISTYNKQDQLYIVNTDVNGNMKVLDILFVIIISSLITFVISKIYLLI